MAAILKILLLSMLAASNNLTAATSEPSQRETVVLLHGMGRTRFSMQKLATQLRREGYDIFNVGYPSTRNSIADSVRHVYREFERHDLTTRQTVHFVTHSLGGVLIRAFLKEHPLANLGRIVMLSPPNQGSELADSLMAGPLRFIYRLTTGPAGQELGTNPCSVPNRLGPVDFPLGVITGNRSLNPLFSSAFSGPNDGKVAVERAKISGMTDFLVLRHSHSFIMRSSVVSSEAIHFLRHGRFSTTEA